MDLSPLFDFLSDKWWLIFPAMGIFAWIGGSIDQALKRRHKRRLEIIRAKGEAKAAQLAARGQQPGTPLVKKRSDAAPPALPQKDLLERLFAEHDEITARWLDYELDVAKLIAFPAMSDGRQPLTAAFLRAKKTADQLRPASATAKITEDAIAEYLDAVGNYAVAFEIAEREARRVRTSNFSEAERKRLDRAQQLLKVAVDEAATQAERNTAYKRVREEIEGLIVLSDEAVTVLEKKVGRELPMRRADTVTPPAPAQSPERMPLPKRDAP